MQRRVPPALSAHVPEADTAVPLGACHQHSHRAWAARGREGAAASSRGEGSLQQLLHTAHSLSPHGPGLGREHTCPLTLVPSWPCGPAPHTASQSTELCLSRCIFSWLKGCVVNSFYTYLLPFSFLWKPQMVSGLSLCLERPEPHGLGRRRGSSLGNPGAPGWKWGLPAAWVCCLHP